jgi:hypothetical protein
MAISPKWRIFVLILPLTILFTLAKLLFHRQGWELWSFNALTSSLFGAATFIVAFQLNGTLSDYRSSDSLLTEFCVAIESIQDNNLLAAQSNVEYDSQPLQQELMMLAQGLRTALQTEQPLQPLLAQVSHFNQSFIQLEKYAIGGSMSRVLDGQFSLRKIMMQIKGVRDSEFIQPAYALLELFTISSTIALLLIKNETISESLIVSSLMFVVFLLFTTADQRFRQSISV